MPESNTSNLKVVFFGTPEIALPTLTALHERYSVACVVTRPDRTRGRDRHKLEYSPVKEFALAHNIAVLQPESHCDEGFREALAAFKADVFCVMAFGLILPQWLIDLPRLGIFNAHTSLLPQLRGAAPINWAIINGLDVTGVSIQRIVKKLDAGPVLWQKKIAIERSDTVETLTAKMAAAAPDGMCETVSLAASGELVEHEQDESLATYAPQLQKEDGLIDWKRSAIEIERQVRGMNPWPGAFTYLNDSYLKIWEAEVAEGVSGEPGAVAACSIRKGLIVACGKDGLLIRTCQQENRKKLESASFLCGCPLEIGFHFSDGEEN